MKPIDKVNVSTSHSYELLDEVLITKRGFLHEEDPPSDCHINTYIGKTLLRFT